MKIDQNSCISCQTCKNSCPCSAIFVNQNGKCEIDQTKCVNCGTCLSLCPLGIISAE